jgi:hypothetical protein
MTTATPTNHDVDREMATEAEDDDVELAIGAPLDDYLTEIDKGGDHGLAPR